MVSTNHYFLIPPLLPSFLHTVTALPFALKVSYIFSQHWESFLGANVLARKQPASLHLPLANEWCSRLLLSENFELFIF
jgi:hypothetical protein